jgi:hypothetical protein
LKKVVSKIFWIVFIFSLIEFQPLSVSGIHENFRYRDYEETPASIDPARPVAIVGDLQRTSLWELMMGREQNDAEREKIIAQISTEDPSMLILLGDMVYDAGSRDQWKYFDRLMEPVNELPVLPLLGNHEYYGSRKGIISSFVSQRFPQFEPSTWYTRTYGNLAFIFLDSNEKKLPAGKWNEQQLWYADMLALYDEDPAIKGIIVFTHHPPFTNSLVTGDEKNIQSAFVTPFKNSEKTIAFISGHAHTYENFKRNGKYFVVSGGGGGPRVFLNKNKNRHTDGCSHEGVRPFHYLLIYPGEDSVELVAKGINKGESEFKLLDSFEMKFRTYAEKN